MSKPFNFDEAVAGKPVEMADGREVKDLHYLPSAAEGVNCFVGTVDGAVMTWNKDGRYFSDGSSVFCLRMKSETRTVWQNFYKSINERIFTSNPFDTNEEAQENQKNHLVNCDYIGTFPTTIEL